MLLSDSLFKVVKMHMFRGGIHTLCILQKEVFHVIDRNFQNNWNKYKRERSADVITYFARECNHRDVSCICQIIYSRFWWLQKDNSFIRQYWFKKFHRHKLYIHLAPNQTCNMLFIAGNTDLHWCKSIHK